MQGRGRAQPAATGGSEVVDIRNRYNPVYQNLLGDRCIEVGPARGRAPRAHGTMRDDVVNWRARWALFAVVGLRWRQPWRLRHIAREAFRKQVHDVANDGRRFTAKSGFQVVIRLVLQRVCLGGVSPRWRPDKVA